MPNDSIWTDLFDHVRAAWWEDGGGGYHEGRNAESGKHDDRVQESTGQVGCEVASYDTYALVLFMAYIPDRIILRNMYDIIVCLFCFVDFVAE